MEEKKKIMNGLGGGSTHSGGRLISFSYGRRGWRWRWLDGCSELNGGDLERTDGHLFPSSSRFLPIDADRRKQILRRQRRHHEEIIADPLSVVKGHTYIFIQPAIQTHVALRGEVRLFFFHGLPHRVGEEEQETKSIEGQYKEKSLEF